MYTPHALRPVHNPPLDYPFVRPLHQSDEFGFEDTVQGLVRVYHRELDVPIGERRAAGELADVEAGVEGVVGCHVGGRGAAHEGFELGEVGWFGSVRIGHSCWDQGWLAVGGSLRAMLASYT